jgi:hypothetical protein
MTDPATNPRVCDCTVSTESSRLPGPVEVEESCGEQALKTIAMSNKDEEKNWRNFIAVPPLVSNCN